ncbi:MAG TPA: hypothetical protein VJU82_16805 [Acidobacteriaceae bacterium]|nr:hypothetical protein [Acidobacteriaceae bacterium]
MLKQLSVVCISATMTLIVPLSAKCQMVVHAVSGVVKSVDSKTKSITIAVDQSDDMQFKIQSGAPPALTFDPELRGDAVDASKFDGKGDFVVVYYYGFDTDRTAVAIKDFGKGQLEKLSGTVTAFDRHNHALTVRTSDGKTEKFQLDDKAVVDTGMGLESGRKYGPGKGDSVRVTATNSNGKDVAVFVRSSGA